MFSPVHRNHDAIRTGTSVDMQIYDNWACRLNARASKPKDFRPEWAQRHSTTVEENPLRLSGIDPEWSNELDTGVGRAGKAFHGI